MTDAELVRETAQPLTDQSGDYNALDQSDARTRAHSQSPATAERNGHASAMDFARSVPRLRESAMRRRIAFVAQ
jgi:hypothetical protein